MIPSLNHTIAYVQNAIRPYKGWRTEEERESKSWRNRARKGSERVMWCFGKVRKLRTKKGMGEEKKQQQQEGVGGDGECADSSAGAAAAVVR